MGRRLKLMTKNFKEGSYFYNVSHKIELVRRLLPDLLLRTYLTGDRGEFIIEFHGRYPQDGFGLIDQILEMANWDFYTANKFYPKKTPSKYCVQFIRIKHFRWKKIKRIKKKLKSYSINGVEYEVPEDKLGYINMYGSWKPVHKINKNDAPLGMTVKMSSVLYKDGNGNTREISHSS